MQSELPSRMLAVKEVAAALRVHPGSVRRWNRAGLLKGYKFGGHKCLRFGQDELFVFLAQMPIVKRSEDTGGHDWRE